jgi:hypothetical protein
MLVEKIVSIQRKPIKIKMNMNKVSVLTNFCNIFSSPQGQNQCGLARKTAWKPTKSPGLIQRRLNPENGSAKNKIGTGNDPD